MWNRILGVGLALSLLAGVAATGWFATATLRPAALNPLLRAEFSAIGLTVGQDRPDKALARFGPPDRVVTEVLTTRYEYTETGVLLRFDRETERLVWYEFERPPLATARGIRPGDPERVILDAYGAPSERVSFSGGTRLRYYFGIAYAMEFLLNPEGQVTRITFFQS